MSNVAAAKKAIGALELDDSKAAMVEVVLSLAAAVDDDPLNASLWREYRLALGDLRGVTDDGDDSFSEVVRWLSSPVRNSPN